MKKTLKIKAEFDEQQNYNYEAGNPFGAQSEEES
jgi:hypothetical protein